VCQRAGSYDALIPQPFETTAADGAFTFSAQTTIVADDTSADAAHLLQEYLRRATGFDLPVGWDSFRQRVPGHAAKWTVQGRTFTRDPGIDWH